MAKAIPKVAKEKTPVPHMLSLWSQFDSQIGEAHRGCSLAHAVRGFFENGGHWCYAMVLKDRSYATLAAGLDAIAHLNSADLVCVPDLSGSKPEVVQKQQMVTDHCEAMGNRFAILDSQPGDSPQEIVEQRSDLDGRNGALYYPWIRVHGFDGAGLETVPPCGHIAGAINRTDHARGVHKAPANELLNGVVDLEYRLTNRDQDILNPKGVNCLRAFPGRGIRIWGARTLSNELDWMYVNVRRLFLTAARWIDWNLLDMTFEPNDARLWMRIERKLTEYFADQYKMGALKGASLKEAFYVKCDADTNPPELRESGRVVTEIGLAPAVPFEFVVVRLIRGSRGASLSNNSTAM
jgi:phage tail sheath protein FI